MKTDLLPGIVPLPFDPEIAEFVAQQAVNPKPGKPRYMAVLNLNGELYRVITIYTPAAAIAFLNTFERRGLFNRIQASLCSAYDVDVLTDERYEGPFTWVLQVGMQATPLPAWPYP